MSPTSKVLQSWIDMINEEGYDLTEWEVNFMESVTEQFETSGRLSEKQMEIVERIYVGKTK